MAFWFLGIEHEVKSKEPSCGVFFCLVYAMFSREKTEEIRQKKQRFKGTNGTERYSTNIGRRYYYHEILVLEQDNVGDIKMNGERERVFSTSF